MWNDKETKEQLKHNKKYLGICELAREGGKVLALHECGWLWFEPCHCPWSYRAAPVDHCLSTESEREPDPGVLGMSQTPAHPKWRTPYQSNSNQRVAILDFDNKMVIIRGEAEEVILIGWIILMVGDSVA